MTDMQRDVFDGSTQSVTTESTSGAESGRSTVDDSPSTATATVGISRPTTMPPLTTSRPPPLGPFPSAYDGAGGKDMPSPIALPPVTPYIPMSAAPMSSAVVFDWSQLQCAVPPSPLSPLTPLSPVDASRRSMKYDLMPMVPMMPMYYPMPQAQPNKPPQSAPTIKHTWYRTFDELFSQFVEPWMLRQIDADDEQPTDGNWATEEYWAKVRFICESDACPNQWTSMRGVIRFWYSVHPLPYSSNGQTVMIRQLLFRSFGQKCAKCANPTFQTPLWYEREVKKVLTRIFEHISRALYGWFVGRPQRGIAYRPSAHVESQRGAPTAEHKSELCQGCANNTCSLSRRGRSRTGSPHVDADGRRSMHAIQEDENATGALASAVHNQLTIAG